MKRVIVQAELVGAVRVDSSRTGDTDPVNDAIRVAKRDIDTPTSPDAEAYYYEAAPRGDHYLVTIRATARGVAYGERADVAGAASDVDTGGFEEMRVLEYVVTDVVDALMDELTVEDLRRLGREHDVSYDRGSRKLDLVEQLVDQEPRVARLLV